MPVFFALGFRPFFLLSGILAVLLVAAWVPALAGWLSFVSYYGQIGWHSHEMIFGYTSRRHRRIFAYRRAQLDGKTDSGRCFFSFPCGAMARR